MIISAAAVAQESTAELRGRVLDAQGGALPGVTITITNQATGVYRAVLSNGDGTYFATALAPGMYSIAAELTGFKKYMRSDVRLDLGRTTTLDLALEIGGLTESVSVTAETPLVDTTSKQIGGNVTTREVSTLPSINGNFVGMVALLPGIVANISTESFGSDAVSVNGLDSRNNNYMLDGANNNDDVIGQRPVRRRVRPSRRSPSSRWSPTSTTPSSAARLAPSSTPSASRGPTPSTASAPRFSRTRR